MLRPCGLFTASGWNLSVPNELNPDGVEVPLVDLHPPADINICKFHPCACTFLSSALGRWRDKGSEGKHSQPLKFVFPYFRSVLGSNK